MSAMSSRVRENERCVQTKMRKREEGAEREREEGVKCCPRTVGVTQRAVAFAFVIINFSFGIFLREKSKRVTNSACRRFCTKFCTSSFFLIYSNISRHILNKGKNKGIFVNIIKIPVNYPILLPFACMQNCAELGFSSFF